MTITELKQFIEASGLPETALVKAFKVHWETETEDVEEADVSIVEDYLLVC